MTTTSRKAKVWGYARVRSIETDDLHKLVIQTYKLTRAGVDANHLLFDIGSANAADKPGFERLIQSMKAGSVDEIVITELDRVFRRLGDFLAFRQLLESFQVKLRILNSSREYDGTLNAVFFSLEDLPHE